MTLSYQSGKFLLTDISVKSGTPSDWVRQVDRDGKVYLFTTSLKAAVAFRSFADDELEKIFDRTFNQRLTLPSLPQLSSLTFLDAHQLEGIRWILSRSRSYLAHAPGAGKTAQAIVASLVCASQGKIVYIVPPQLTANWAREIEKFARLTPRPYMHGYVPPTISIVKKSKSKDAVDWHSDIIIVPDSMLTKAWVYEELLKLPIKFIAVDEASRFKEPTSARTLALFGGNRGGTDGGYKYRGLVKTARHVVLLDGSPMPNRAMELWAPAYALDPWAIECMSQQEFGFKYCGAKLNERGEWEFKHSSREDELRMRLQRSFMHVVTEDKLEHPERRRSLLFMDQDVRSPEHKTWEKRHLKSLSFDDIDEDLSRGELARFRQELGMRKAPWIARYVSERMANKDESILLFVWHRDVAFLLQKTLAKFKPGLLIGGVKENEREQIIAEFQSGKRKLIIANIQAAGRGHNLQRADRVIFGEFSWTDELNKQCEHRAARRGRDREQFVRCEYVVAPLSMDEPILNSCFTKQNRVRRIIG